MRTIETHKTNACSEALTITALDEPSPGGASRAFTITGFDPKENHAPGHWKGDVVNLWFQNGDPAKVGVNGITSEALLAVLIDRHTGFDNGPFSSLENKEVLDHLKQALDWCHYRTRQRQQRGVEGKMEK